MELHVTKYHGLGNDFIVMREEEAAKVADLNDLIVQVCDRHTGIGADGFIIPKTMPEGSEAQFEMVYYNQDGSRAPMCGNGIRCLSGFLSDEKLIDCDVLPIATLAGLKTVTIENLDPFQVRPMCGNGIRCLSGFLSDEKLIDCDVLPIATLAGLKTVTIENLDPFQVRVNMGKADFAPEAIAAQSDQPVWDLELDTDQGKQTVCSFFMSTVHTVVFDDDPMGDIEQKGKALCFHPFYTEQTNVNFVNVLDPKHIQVQTYERGCGVTLACGTGVCASALTCYLKGLCGPKMDVELKRGHLTIEIDDEQTVFMSGPAQKIMEGTYLYHPSTK